MREYINLKDVITLNLKDADGIPCEYCKLPIEIIPNRKNRVDCEDEEKIVSYHIWCYDMILLDKLTYHTHRIMVDLLKEFGVI